MNRKIRVTVWNEFRHELDGKHPSGKVYPKGMHAAIAKALAAEPDFEVRTATLDEPEHGLSKETLEATDVLTWWGHMAHGEVKDEIVERVYQRVVLGGMGLIVLHSGHFSKIFRKLMGTSCDLRWREIGREGAHLGRRAEPSDRRRACRRISRSRTRRCTASGSTSPRPTRSCS